MTTLPETQPATRPEEFPVAAGTEMEAYDMVVRGHALALAKSLGVTPMELSYRIYGERVMWRMLLAYNPKSTNEEVKRICWDLLTRAFAAYKPEFYKPDNAEMTAVVGVWFTDGAKFAVKITPF